MPLTAANLPDVLHAARAFRDAVAAWPSDPHRPEAEAAVLDAWRAEEALRRTLTPSKPDWRWDHNEDLEHAELPPAVAQLLREVWRSVVRDGRCPPPVFAPEQRDGWLVLLEKVLRTTDTRARGKVQEARDRWIYKECCDTSRTYKEIIGRLREQCKARRWSPITTVQGIRQAASKYAERHGLEHPPRRQDL